MKINKKNPKKQLERFSTVFMQLGLVLALLVTYFFIEYETDNKVAEEFIIPNPTPDRQLVLDDAPKIFRKEVLIKRVEIPKEVVKKPTNLSKVIKVNNNKVIIESVIQKPNKNVVPKIVKSRDIVEVDLPEDVDEDVPFIRIEKVPVYPGCKGKREELAKCLNKSINSTVLKAFDTESANDAGITGSHRIFVKFKIDKTGKVSSIQALHKNKILRKLAEKAVKELPLMKPGKQRNKPVNMPYVLPISFTIE